MELADRTRVVSPSYTIGISMKVSEMNGEGRNIINLSVGEPDFSVPKKAKQEMITAVENDFTSYDKVPGLIELRKAISQKLKLENGINYALDQIVVSNGAKQAIMNALLVTLNMGDEVIIPAPYWTSYPEIVKLCGGVPVIIYPEDNEKYKITVEDLEKAVTEKTKMLFFNNPSNPSGIIYTKEEVAEIAEFCVKNQIWIMSDEIYERFCFEGEYASIASVSEATKKITILVNGLSKSAAMTGLRIGYTASTKEVAAAISTIQGHLTSHPSTISQWGACAALLDCREEIDAQLEVYRHRREIILSRLDEMEAVTYLRPEGAFYVMVNVGAYREKVLYEDSFSVAFCERLLNEGQVAAVPGIAFGLDDYVRIAYTVNEKDLIFGLERIDKFLKTL